MFSSDVLWTKIVPTLIVASLLAVFFSLFHLLHEYELLGVSGWYGRTTLSLDELDYSKWRCHHWVRNLWDYVNHPFSIVKSNADRILIRCHLGDHPWSSTFQFYVILHTSTRWPNNIFLKSSQLQNPDFFFAVFYQNSAPLFIRLW